MSFSSPGEPGIGKSRIAAALSERLGAEPHLWLRYFCSRYHRDSALYPFIDQLSRAAGLSLDDMPPAKIDKLEALLARTAPPSEDVPLLADLLSLPPSERHPLPNLSPQRKKERTLGGADPISSKGWRGSSRCCWYSRMRSGSTRLRVRCSTLPLNASVACRCC